MRSNRWLHRWRYRNRYRFRSKDWPVLFDAGLEIFRLHLRRVGIGTATTGDEKNGYWNDFEEMS